jgi:DNA-binding HxlR family transcriptional regulator
VVARARKAAVWPKIGISRLMAKKSLDRNCPLARSLDIVGERWTLLIIRDLLSGAMRFQDLLESISGIAPNVLSDRLKTLESHGVVKRSFYSDHPPRAEYSLTEKGLELGVVVLALGRWGVRHLDVKSLRTLRHDECHGHLKLATQALLRRPVHRRNSHESDESR